MTLMEFAIARTFAQLIEARKRRELSKEEKRLLAEVSLCVERYRERESKRERLGI